MVHRNARLAVAGRLILVQRVLSGRPVAHVAKELGISRTCAHRWVRRFRSEGATGLRDHSSRPRSTPTATSPELTARLLRLRTDERLGRDAVAARVGVSPSTASRIIARAGLPRLHELDPVTGILIRASRRTQLRYEHDHPGDLLHVDVKKIGRIPDGGGWRIDGPDVVDHNRGRVKSAKLGMDFLHVAVDDHSRIAFVRVFPEGLSE